VALFLAGCPPSGIRSRSRRRTSARPKLAGPGTDKNGVRDGFIPRNYAFASRTQYRSSTVHFGLPVFSRGAAT